MSLEGDGVGVETVQEFGNSVAQHSVDGSLAGFFTGHGYFSRERAQFDR